EYFGETAFGNVALPAGIAGAGLAAAAFGAAGGDAPPGAEAAAGFAAASDPHSALRKSFHFWPLSVPAVCAALYLALHSFIVSALADVPHAANIPIIIRLRIFITVLLVNEQGSYPGPNSSPSRVRTV